MSNGPAVRVRGRIDRLERDAEGRLVVVDVKTGKTPVSKDDAQRHAQLALYQLAVAQGLASEDGAPGGGRLVYVGKAAAGGATEREQDAQTPDAANEWRNQVGDGGGVCVAPLPVLLLPETVEQVSRVLRYCYDNGIRVVPRGSGTSLSGGALPLEDGVLLGHVEVQPHPRHRLSTTARSWSQPGVTNLGITKAVDARRLLLRARPVLADRLLDRRQRRGEFRRRALPEIRPDRQQRARHRDGADRPARWSGSAASISMPKATTCSALMTGSEGLLGVVTEVTVRILQLAGDGARPADRLSVERGGRPLRRRHHRRRHHPGRHGDDGPAGDPCGRRFRPCRLSARCARRC